MPIIETQAGDVSAFVPTNVISITDGQIFLEADMFNAGYRPAMNAGIRYLVLVVRAQTKIIKKLVGGIRTALAQYRELAAFSQFASDLDDATQAQLDHGAACYRADEAEAIFTTLVSQKWACALCGERRLFERSRCHKDRRF